MIYIERKWNRELYRTTKHENAYRIVFINAQVPSDRHGSKTQDRGAQGHREGITEYAPSYALLHFFRTLTFCKQFELWISIFVKAFC